MERKYRHILDVEDQGSNFNDVWQEPQGNFVFTHPEGMVQHELFAREEPTPQDRFIEKVNGCLKANGIDTSQVTITPVDRP